MKSTIKRATKVAEELHQSNVNSDTKKESTQHTKSKIRKVFKEKIGKESNAWPILEVWIDSLLVKKTPSYGYRGKI